MKISNFRITSGKKIIAISVLMMVAIVTTAQHKFTLFVKTSTPITSFAGAGEAYFLNVYKTAKFAADSVAYENGGYSFTGEIMYPTAIRIYQMGDTKIRFNELVFIDSGYQEIELAIVNDSVTVNKRPVSAIEKDHEKLLKVTGVKRLDSKIPLDRFRMYLKQHPSSYAALFAMIDQTFNYDLQPEIKQIAKLFDETILRTKGFQAFEQEYFSEKKIPAIKVYNEKKSLITLKTERTDRRFTLIEFWFAGCQGCVPVMKTLQKKYSSIKDKIRIINISTDPPNRINAGLAILKKQKVPWEYFWDFNEKQFSKYTQIYVYPSNLLLDDKGNVVGKNIDINNIEAVLSL